MCAATRAATEIDPLNALLESLVGIADLNDGNPSGGLTHTSRALELDPLSLPARMFHSVILAAAGRLEEALTHFELLERHHHDNPVAVSAIRLGKVLAGDRSAVLAPLSEVITEPQVIDRILDHLRRTAAARCRSRAPPRAARRARAAAGSTSA